MTLEKNPYAPPGANPAAADSDRPLVVDHYAPQGIGGWLVLPAFGLCASPIHQITGLVRRFKPLLDPGELSALITPGGPNYHPLLAPLLIFEAASILTMIAFTLVMLWLFFNKSRRVPRLMVIWLAAGVLVPIVDHLLVRLIPAVAEQQADQSVAFIRSILTGGVWTAYFLRSVRVKNTFVR